VSHLDVSRDGTAKSADSFCPLLIQIGACEHHSPLAILKRLFYWFAFCFYAIPDVETSQHPWRDRQCLRACACHTRMTLRRFTRLTNGHSKKQKNHDAMLGLYFAWYNFCRTHMTLKTTPAVKAGIVPSKWTLETLLTVAAAG